VLLFLFAVLVIVLTWSIYNMFFVEGGERKGFFATLCMIVFLSSIDHVMKFLGQI